MRWVVAPTLARLPGRRILAESQGEHGMERMSRWGVGPSILMTALSLHRRRLDRDPPLAGSLPHPGDPVSGVPVPGVLLLAIGIPFPS